MQKKVLVIGATGAMAKYLVPLLAEQGYMVDGISQDEAVSKHPNVRYFQASLNQWCPGASFGPFLQNKYDAIVDFMIYGTESAAMLPYLVKNTGHYIYLSSYRIYDNKEIPIKETSPRLLDSCDNVIVRNSNDYSVFKARGENIMRSLPTRNWTIIRPAITYSLFRYQLVTLEAANTVGRAFAGKKVIVPEQAKNVQGTMSWAGDVAKMIAGLLFNDKAWGETFTVATAEHHSWGEIAEYYRDICGLQAVWVDQEDYLRILSDPYWTGARWQLEYDRLFDRIIDNSKILNTVNLKQSDLMKLYDGLKYEIGRCPRDKEWKNCDAMDAYIREKGL